MKTVQVVLFAPESFRRASEAVRDLVTNGCGPGGWKVDLVPDTIWGLDVSRACDIHDWMYHEGEDLAAKEHADRVLLNNLLRLIEARTRLVLLKWLRRRRAMKYYLAVKHFGGPAFWADKNHDSNLIEEDV